MFIGVVGCGGSSGVVGVGIEVVVFCCERGCCCGWLVEEVVGSEGCIWGGSCVGGGVGVCFGGGCRVWDWGLSGMVGGVGIGVGIVVVGGCWVFMFGGVWWGVGVWLGTGEGEFWCRVGWGRGG